MSNFMQNVKRKWNIQKLGVQLVGIEAMAYYLLVGVSVLLVALLVSVRIFFAYDITNSDYTIYLNFFGILMLASNPLYWICKDMGEKRKKKLLIDKKGAVDSMEILAILPIQKREGVNCNFYRWLLVNILNVIAIIYMEFNAVKYGMATIPEKFFVVFPLFSMLFQTLYWIAVIVNQRWIFLASSVIGMVSYTAYNDSLHFLLPFPNRLVFRSSPLISRAILPRCIHTIMAPRKNPTNMGKTSSPQ